jgi:hypothetical protein
MSIFNEKSVENKKCKSIGSIRVSLILATSQNGVIGVNKCLPWHLAAPALRATQRLRRFVLMTRTRADCYHSASANS